MSDHYNITNTSTSTIISDENDENIGLKILCIIVVIILSIFVCIVSLFSKLIIVDWLCLYKPDKPLISNLNVKKIETKENIYVYI